MDGELMNSILFILLCCLYAISAQGQILTAGSGGLSLGTISTPTDSPGAGTYPSTQTVTLADVGADFIRYTTDGSTPTYSAGTLYTTGISVSTTTTIKAVGCVSAFACGGILTSIYTISTIASKTGACYAGYAGTAVAPSSSVNVAIGDTVFVLCVAGDSCSSTGVVFSVTDTAGNSYSAIGANNDIAGQCSRVFYTKATLANAADYPSCSDGSISGQTLSISVLPLSGTGASPLDAGPASNAGVATGTPASASYTTTTAVEMLVASITDAVTPRGYTAATGYTLGTGTQCTTTGPTVGIEYKNVTTIQTGITSSFTETGSTTYYANIGVGTFK